MGRAEWRGCYGIEVGRNAWRLRPGMSEDRVRCQAGIARQSLVHVIQEFTLGAQSLGDCNRGSRCRY